MNKQQRRLKERQLLTCIPDVLNHKSLLYIGASNKRQEVLSLFIKKNYVYTILEIWRSNVEYLKSKFKNVIEGDVRNVDKLGLGLFDIVMWWHGPEHVRKNEIVPIFDKLINMTKKTLIIACPWGIYEQDAAGGNPYEKHFSYLYPEFFENLGWQTSAIGIKDTTVNNLMAWKHVMKISVYPRSK